ncbi:hypothetical protein [Cesiribacter andamanensis]|uniref:Uncharacterized protein n=1 Tax=Cesiribacter andamanensis AMV16 TaxID=1279009 RepID=M7NGI7_9BACT|nr:hypothetical protein [Cesiribacter andamanensis]EMR00950.1 hypothetical protein ADICEAN_03929 [Cesiribacter andamanensis AMV16]
MENENKGFDPAVIADYRSRMQAKKQNYLIIESEDNSEDYINFNFIGEHEGKEVVFDAVLYTLRLHYHSELYELAEHKAAQRFPNYKNIRYEEDENGDLKALNDEMEEIGLYMAEVMMELEDEEAVKVQEHVYLDPNLDFGVGLDAALNVDTITPKVISRFIEQFNADTLELDETLYSFVEEEEDLN